MSPTAKYKIKKNFKNSATKNNVVNIFLFYFIIKTHSFASFSFLKAFMDQSKLFTTSFEYNYG